MTFTDVVGKIGLGATVALVIAAGLYLSTLGKFGPGLAGMALSAGFAAMQRAREKATLGDAALLGGPGVVAGGAAAYFMG